MSMSLLLCHVFEVHPANRQGTTNPGKAVKPQDELTHACLTTHLRSRHNTPSPNDVICVTCEQSLSVRAPCQTDTLWLSALLANSLELWLQLINLALLLQIEDDDAAGGGGAKPVSVGGENEGVDLITSVQGVEVLRLVQVPQHGGSVLSTGSAEGSVWGDGDGVDVTGVSDVVGLQSARAELPDLKN